jgi:hypothetical protein
VDSPHALGVAADVHCRAEGGGVRAAPESPAKKRVKCPGLLYVRRVAFDCSLTSRAKLRFYKELLYLERISCSLNIILVQLYLVRIYHGIGVLYNLQICQRASRAIQDLVQLYPEQNAV